MGLGTGGSNLAYQVACKGSNSTYEVSSTSRYGLKVLAVQGLGLVFHLFFFTCGGLAFGPV